MAQPLQVSCRGRGFMQAGNMQATNTTWGSCVVVSRVVGPLIWVISAATLLVTVLMTTHDPPSASARLARSSRPCCSFFARVALSLAVFEDSS